MVRRGKLVVVLAAALAVALVALPGSASAFGPVASFGGVDGSSAGQLSAPGGIAVAADGSVFVADRGNDRVSVFSPAGEFLYAFGAGVGPGSSARCDAGTGCAAGSGGSAGGALNGPEGIAISGSGDVYVSEQGNDRVSVFSLAGVFQFAFGYDVDPGGGMEAKDREICLAGSTCQAGTNLREPEDSELFTQEGPEGALSEPAGIAIGPAGQVFVAEEGNSRVSVFNPLGEFVFMFGSEVEGKAPFGSSCERECIEAAPNAGPGGLDFPTGIAVLAGGRLAIGEAESHRVDVFEANGTFVRGFGHGVNPGGGDVCTTETGCQEGSGESAGSLASPAGLSADPAGSIYVGDVGLERVSQFTTEGQFVRAFGAGVLDGAAAFQSCTGLSGCRAGIQSAVSGATPHPFGLAAACRGGVFVSEATSGLSRVERFGDADAFTPPCPPQPAPLSVRLTPTNRFQFGRLRRNPKRGTAELLVAVPGAGQLTISGKGVHRASRNVAGAGAVALPVSLVGKARRRLLATGRHKVAAKVTFTPSGGSAGTEMRKLTLVQKLPRQRRGR